MKLFENVNGLVPFKFGDPERKPIDWAEIKKLWDTAKETQYE